MNFKAKVLMVAKAISVWWGIFVILGCCIGFFLKVVIGLFGSEASGFDIKLFVPFMIGGSLLLATAAAFLNMALRRAPELKTSRMLDAVIRKQGVCKEYTDMLFDAARADRKNYYCIQIAACYCVMGDDKQAKALIDRLDVVSVLDIAQTTGDYTTAAYYYACAVLEAIQSGDMEAADKTYENGGFYLNSLSGDKYILAVTALCDLRNGNADLAAQKVLGIKTEGISSHSHVLRCSLIVLIKAHILLSAGKYKEASDAVEEALNFKITPNYERIAVEIGRKIRECSSERTEEQVAENQG